MAEYVHNGTEAVNIGESVDIKINIASILVSELKEIRGEINKLQTYKLFSGDTELYLSKDDVIAILDKKISELEVADD